MHEFTLTVYPHVEKANNIVNYRANPSNFKEQLENLKHLKATFPKIGRSMPIMDTVEVYNQTINTVFLPQVCMYNYPSKITQINAAEWIVALVGTGDGGWVMFFEDDKLMKEWNVNHLFGAELVNQNDVCVKTVHKQDIEWFKQNGANPERFPYHQDIIPKQQFTLSDSFLKYITR